MPINNDAIIAWKSEGLLGESIKLHFTSYNSLNLELNHIDNPETQVKFGGSCREQKTFTPRKIINLYIVYKINLWPYNYGTSFTLGNYLFEAAKLTKNVDLVKYSYSGYGIGFDACGIFFIIRWQWSWYKCNNIWS